MRARILCGRVTARASRQAITTATIFRTGPRAMQLSWKSEHVLKATRRLIQISTSEPSPERSTHIGTGHRIQKRNGVANGLPLTGARWLPAANDLSEHVDLMLEFLNVVVSAGVACLSHVLAGAK